MPIASRRCGDGDEESIGIIDIRKVDKVWCVDLLVNG
jgi:hypothetical protein